MLSTELPAPENLEYNEQPKTVHFPHLFEDDEALPAEFDNFMEPDYVIEKVIANLKLEEPEQDLIIKRPTA